VGRHLDHLAAQSRLNRNRKSSTWRERKKREGAKGVLEGRGQHLCDERRQGVGGMAVKGMPRSVVAAGSAQVGVASGILDVAQREPRSNASVTIVCRRLCGVMCLASRASRAPIRQRRPQASANHAPSRGDEHG
jgi:hypothetical protein